MNNISVVIPTYNRAKKVSISIESVLAQTHPAAEIIVVDDGSKDDTSAVLATYGDRIKAIRQTNAGPSVARNTGIMAAKSEWIAFLDDDDKFTPDRLQVAAEAMRLHPDAVVHMCNLAVVTDNKVGSDLFTIRGLHATETMRVDRPLIWTLRGCSFVQTLVARRDALIATGLFKKMFYEDLDLILRLCRQGAWTVDRRPLAQLSRTTGEVLSVSAYWNTKPIEEFGTLVRIYSQLLQEGDLNDAERTLVSTGVAINAFALGRAHYLAGDVAKARECFKNCIETAPSARTRVKAWLPLWFGSLGLRAADIIGKPRKVARGGKA